MVADGARLAPEGEDGAAARPSRFPLVDPSAVSAGVRETFEEIRAFFQVPAVPQVFRVMAADEGYLKAFWGGVRFALGEGKLDRLTKACIGLGVSLAGHSDYGIALHLGQARRLGLTDRGAFEVLQVVQCFSALTKIADQLHLQSDWTHFLPDPSRRRSATSHRPG